MKMRLRLELIDVFGGDSEVRFEPKERVALSRHRTRTILKDRDRVELPETTKEEVRESKMEPIATFRVDKDGVPLLRLGGAHGKFWGAMKNGAKHLYELGEEDFQRSYKSVVEMVIVSPSYVRLEGSEELRVEGVPQMLKGAGGGMVVFWYDVVPSAKATVTIEFPDKLKRKVEKLLMEVEKGTHFNKRRTSIKIIERSEV